MGKSSQQIKKAQAAQKSKRRIFIASGVAAILLIIAIIAIKANTGSKSNAVNPGGDLTILKSEVTEVAKFYPYKLGKTKMEVLAIKADDGTIRTAFNTCQVCYSSGRGYYKQEGKVLVCQNCGNRFQADQVEIIAGGCNPVPITGEYKTDDGTNIVIQAEIFEAAKDLFANWKR
jgi:uncharacterized membrane protein